MDKIPAWCIIGKYNPRVKWKFLRVKFILAAVLAFSFSHSQSQTLVGTVMFEGNTVFSDNDLKGSMILKADKKFSEEQMSSDLKSIRERYRSSGYLNARISDVVKKFTSDSSYVDIKISITEGRPAIIGEINIRGNRTITTAEIKKNSRQKQAAFSTTTRSPTILKPFLKRMKRKATCSRKPWLTKLLFTTKRIRK